MALKSAGEGCHPAHIKQVLVTYHQYPSIRNPWSKDDYLTLAYDNLEMFFESTRDMLDHDNWLLDQVAKDEDGLAFYNTQTTETWRVSKIEAKSQVVYDKNNHNAYSRMYWQTLLGFYYHTIPDERCVVYATVRDDGSDTALDYIASALTPAPSYQEIDDAVYQEIGKHIADFPDDDRLENYIPHHVLKKLNIIDSMVHH